jgi:phosphoglycolate phosphatase
MPRLVLFDIDGTLLRTGGVGQDATRIAMERVFGTSGNLPAFYPGGRTIEAILFDTLLDAQIRPEFIRAGRRLFYAEFIAAFSEAINNGGYTVRPCPGSIDLVNALSAQKNIVLGLLTGNHQKTAELKMKAAGFELTPFQIGAYGHEAVDRALLVGLAKDRAFKQVGVHFAPQEIVVLGDTTRDVMAAKDAGVRNIAVATGTDDYEMLQACEPDFLFENFEETQAVLRALLS